MQTELLTDPGHTRADLRQIESAIRKGWIIPDELLSFLPKKAGAIALNGKPRDQIAAMRVIIEMKRQNEEKQPIPQQIEHHHTHELGPVTAENLGDHKRRLAERIARLGRNG